MTYALSYYEIERMIGGGVGVADEKSSTKWIKKVIVSGFSLETVFFVLAFFTLLFFFHYFYSLSLRSV